MGLELFCASRRVSRNNKSFTLSYTNNKKKECAPMKSSNDYSMEIVCGGLFVAVLVMAIYLGLTVN